MPSLPITAGFLRIVPLSPEFINRVRQLGMAIVMQQFAIQPFSEFQVVEDGFISHGLQQLRQP